MIDGLTDDLLGRVSLPLHRDVLHPSMLGIGLSQTVDHYPGVPSQRRGDGDRCGPPLWGGASDGARVAAQVRGRGAGRVGRSQFEAVVVPASDGPGGRGADRGDAPGASGVGAAHDPVLARARGRGAGAGADVGRAVPGPPRAGHPAGPEAEAVAITSGGNGQPGDGVVADGHRRRGAARRRVARRRSCRASMTTPGSWCRRRWWRGRRRGRCATRSTLAMRRHGVPEQILTDNGKVFTARFGPGPGPVLFDRICTDNGIKHLLTAPRSPTTTGKVERWHKTLRREFLDGKVFASIDDAQAAARRLGRVTTTTSGRTSRSGGCRRSNGSSSPSRGRAAGQADCARDAQRCRGPVTTRRVSAKGTIRFATASYKAGRVAGRPDRRGGLRRRAGAAPSPRCARSPPTPAGTPSTSRPPALRTRPQAAARHDRPRRRRR